MIGIICTLTAVLLLVRIHEYMLVELLLTIAILSLYTNHALQEQLQEQDVNGTPVPRRYFISKKLIALCICLFLAYAVYLNAI